ncbi:hypothetical protein P3W85_29890 [Cupriavidus basilensis]|uniref:Uncharacterized protein n=1 Tax=Cupriavidus basilensis TaxID=68895 RepID=A0ABT6AWX7_9BURK|nr:hypothetical protein [Cupriavidus basilensis]MDF3837135.1 hypothetical protein [Cupriavidus basilensis]
MNTEGMTIRADLVPWSHDIELRLGVKRDGRLYSIARPLVFEDIPNGARVDPFVTMDAGTAQNLMDELWRCGLRPRDGTGSAGALAATERHLNDMRRLVFEDKIQVRVES